MHLIWFNGTNNSYEYGDISRYQSEKMKADNIDKFTVLMEFSSDDDDLATKVIEELNQTNDEHALAS